MLSIVKDIKKSLIITKKNTQQKVIKFDKVEKIDQKAKYNGVNINNAI